MFWHHVRKYNKYIQQQALLAISSFKLAMYIILHDYNIQFLAFVQKI